MEVITLNRISALLYRIGSDEKGRWKSENVPNHVFVGTQRGALVKLLRAGFSRFVERCEAYDDRSIRAEIMRWSDSMVRMMDTD